METESIYNEKDVEVLEMNPLSQRQHMADSRKEVGVKLRLHMDFVDDINEEICLDATLSLHFNHEAACKHVTGMPGFAVVNPEESLITVPNIEFLNTRSCEHKEGFKLLICTQTGMVFVYRVYRLAIKERLELDRFPFDRQVFKCKIKSYSGILVGWSVPESLMPVGIKSDSLWRKHDVIVESDRDLWHLDWIKCHTTSTDNPSIYSACFGMTRSSTFYMTNFVLVTFFVVGTSITCIAIDHTQYGDRAAITFTIMLTMVAFKFVMSAYIPKISYLTLLDYYNILGMMLVVTVVVENFFVSKLFFDDSDIPDMVDYYFASLFIAFWVCLHVIITIGEWWGLFYASWEYVEKHDGENTIAHAIVGGPEEQRPNYQK